MSYQSGAVRLTPPQTLYERIFNSSGIGRTLVNLRPKRSPQNSPRINRRNPHTRRALDQDSVRICPPARGDFCTHHPPRHRHLMKKHTGAAWMQAKLSRHRRAAQAAAFMIPPAPPVSPARPPQTQPPAIAQPTKVMTESIVLTTSAAKISALVATGGKYLTSLASRLIDNVTENSIDELSWTIGDIRHTLLGTQVMPFPGQFSAVRPMNRFALVSSMPGNEEHVERLTSAARIALSNRDPQAADRAVRAIGAEGFATEVTGV